ncbi:MAG TPA: WS/DGAT domain-containing protein, partial [Gemmatimonadales bacterium]|nr:WS/DGAT domain-containing protein [Gemmatimonadales bacterium]
MTRSAGAERRERVSGNDAMWLQDTAANLMIINAVFTSDRMDLATFREAFRQRVIEADGGNRFPRFRQRIARDRGGPHWEVDPAFDLDRHILPAREPDLTTIERLQRYIGDEAGRPLPDDRPRWQIQIVERFDTDESAFIVRIHHSMGDGIALVAVLFTLMEEMTAEHEAPTGAIRPSAGARGGGLLRALTIPFAAPAILLKLLFWVPDRTALHGRPISGTKHVAWTRPIDLALVKQVKDRLGATVNDVLMACVSGALSRYLEEYAGEIVHRIRVSMPVNVRPPEEPPLMENRFAAVPLELPAGIRRAADRVRAVKARMDALKRSVQPIVIYGLQRALLSVLPQGASRALIDFLANKCTAVVTNVPGPQRDLRLAGRRVRSMMFWVPQRADIGVGISILSFAGKVQVGVLADAVLVSDAARLAHAFEEEFDALQQVGGEESGVGSEAG